jgi:CRP/FNR family transcriptional regulator, cyclic AMP receptor protein
MRLHRDARTDLIRSIPLFEGCTEAELVRIAAIAEEIEFSQGRRLTKESAPGHELVILVDGSAEVRQGNQVVNRIGAGEFVGEVALVTGQPRTATVVATSPVHALVIEAQAFRQLLAESPDIRARLEHGAWEHLAHDATTADS